MKIRNITFHDSSDRYYACQEWIVEADSKNYEDLLPFCQEHFKKRKRSKSEYDRAKATVSPNSAEGLMCICGDGYYELTILNDGKCDQWGFYQWRYLTFAENIY